MIETCRNRAHHDTGLFRRLRFLSLCSDWYCSEKQKCSKGAHVMSPVVGKAVHSSHNGMKGSHPKSGKKVMVKDPRFMLMNAEDIRDDIKGLTVRSKRV